jgi:NADH-quinone oxidoreductase subunit L
MTSTLLIAVPGLPLLLAGILLVGGRWLSRLSGWMALVGIAGSLVCLLALTAGRPLSVSVQWALSGGFDLQAGLWLDSLGWFMALFVAVICFWVTWYACGYMAQASGREQSRFFWQLSFFAGAMLTLVLAKSFVLLFAAWEWVGLASFLLIGFWYRKEEARDAARKAFLMTRIGDVSFLLGWLWAMGISGSADIPAFLDRVRSGGVSAGLALPIALLLLMGALGKSAQLPFSAWLPPAMAGPTPVSALLHSATMVAAGVYLVLRLYPLFELVPAVLTVILWIGVLTALFAAFAATVQTDLKRVLAWSTVSQIGEMMLALGLAAPLAALFHLCTHGVFKSTLFLGAGAVEHGTGSRRLDQLGRLAGNMPVTAVVFGAAALSLAGFPFLSGYFSEDHILAAAAGKNAWAGASVLLLVFLAGVYSSRAATAVFVSWPWAPAPEGGDPGPSMRIGMIGLGLLAVGLGWVLSGNMKHLVDLASGPKLPLPWKAAAMIAALLGIGLGWLRVRRRGPRPALGGFPAWLEAALNAATGLAPRFTVRFAAGLQSVEEGIDRFAAGLHAGFQKTGGLVDRSESGLDRLAGRISHGIFRTAAASERMENSGFSDGLDRFAALFSRAGRQTGRWQTGKIYLYVAGLFVWVVLTGLFGVFVWLA